MIDGEQKEAFVFYETFIDSIKELEPEDQYRFLCAIVNYGIYGIEEAFSGMEKALWLQMKNAIDRSKERRKMGIRKIREIGDEVLTKQCKEVTKMSLRTKILIGDMLDTMYEAMGVGLAAPQVGVLKRIVVIDVGEGPIILINPEILETSGEQTGEEGCLSVPGKSGVVTRPDYVKVRALNEDMEEIELEGEGLLARAFCHEIDHLDGHMYVELVEGELHDVGAEPEEEEDEV